MVFRRSFSITRSPASVPSFSLKLSEARVTDFLTPKVIEFWVFVVFWSFWACKCLKSVPYGAKKLYLYSAIYFLYLDSMSSTTVFVNLLALDLVDPVSDDEISSFSKIIETCFFLATVYPFFDFPENYAPTLFLAEFIFLLYYIFCKK